MNRRQFLVAGGALAALTPAATLAERSAAVAASTKGKPKEGYFHQDGPDWFTNVEVQSHDGRTLRFYDDCLRGKIVLINFFFTACDAICPLMADNLARLQEMLAPRLGRDIFMYSISLQPYLDTPEMLRAYANKYSLGPGWLFLTGKPTDIELLRQRLGFVDIDPVQDADLEQHIGAVRIANEPLHRWSMSPALADPEVLVRAVSRVIPGGLRQ
jgi:protein SCO1/2